MFENTWNIGEASAKKVVLIVFTEWQHVSHVDWCVIYLRVNSVCSTCRCGIAIAGI